MSKLKPGATNKLDGAYLRQEDEYLLKDGGKPHDTVSQDARRKSKTASKHAEREADHARRRAAKERE